MEEKCSMLGAARFYMCVDWIAAKVSATLKLINLWRNLYKKVIYMLYKVYVAASFSCLWLNALVSAIVWYPTTLYNVTAFHLIINSFYFIPFYSIVCISTGWCFIWCWCCRAALVITKSQMKWMKSWLPTIRASGLPQVSTSDLKSPQVCKKTSSLLK